MYGGGRGVHVCLVVCVAEVSAEYLPGLFPTLFFETGSLTESGAKLTWPASPKDLPVSVPLVLGLQICGHLVHLWYRVVGTRTQVLRLK